MIRPLVVAHRGGGGLAPENTLAACALAARLGVDAVEVDVRLTADGQPVLLHDATLERTTDGGGPVATMPLAAVQRLDATARFAHRGFAAEPPPSLAQALALLHGRVAVHVELKGEPGAPATLVEAVISLLQATPAHPSPRLLSFDWDALRLARRLAPAVSTEPLLADWPTNAHAVFADLAASGARWVGIRYAALTPARVSMVHAAALRLNTWTVNGTPSLVRAVRCELDSISTDRPDRLLRLLASSDPSA